MLQLQFIQPALDEHSPNSNGPNYFDRIILVLPSGVQPDMKHESAS